MPEPLADKAKQKSSSEEEAKKVSHSQQTFRVPDVFWNAVESDVWVAEERLSELRRRMRTIREETEERPLSEAELQELKQKVSPRMTQEMPPKMTLEIPQEPYQLTSRQELLGWTVPLFVVIVTILASSLPGPIGEATRQFFFIQR